MIRSWCERLARTISFFVTPAFCTYCRSSLESQKPLCESCTSLIRPIASTCIKLTAARSIKVFAVSPYDDPLRPLILAKNHGNMLASKQLGLLMATHIPVASVPCDYIIPVPMHWSRYSQRGFNQAELIARSLGSFLHKPVIKALKRTKRTQFQARLSLGDRYKNIDQAFELAVPLEILKDKNLVLVDDLMTTGATLRAAGHLLLQAKPALINAWVACRVL
jgi:ComF family protein